MTDNLRALALAAKNATCFDDLQDAIDAMDHMTTPDAVLALLDEMDRMKAEIADHERAYELLFKECGELRKDAERYRHIVKFGTIDCAAFYWSSLSKNKGFIDDFIDAAKGEEPECTCLTGQLGPHYCERHSP